MEIKIGSFTYQVRRLGVFQQFEVARKLSAPLMMLALQKDRTVLRKNFGKAFCAMTANMQAEDVESVNNLCLSSVMRLQSNNVWANVMVNGQLMFVDISLNDMLDLIWHVIEEHRLVDFFDEPPSTGGTPGQQLPGQ